MAKIKAGIVGASGYAGVELVRLLLAHPQAEIAAVSSISFVGKPLAEVYPALLGQFAGVLQSEEDVLAASDVVFAALPHGLSQGLAAKCDAAGKKCIDLGADFRLADEEQYAEWYGGGFADKALHAKAVYGLPELYRADIQKTALVANPGCYPTASALALAPLLQKWGPVPVIIDAKSGVTGAGRTLSDTTHFAACNESVSPYKVASHRHTPEIEQTLSRMADGPVVITFVPHLLPVNRGILATCYVSVPSLPATEELQGWYRDFYKGEPFVRVLPAGQAANIRDVKLSNFCDISLHIDERAGRVVVVSALDNMVKGAAGQAIQNMNLLFGFDETAGLMQVPPSF